MKEKESIMAQKADFDLFWIKIQVFFKERTQLALNIQSSPKEYSSKLYENNNEKKKTILNKY